MKPYPTAEAANDPRKRLFSRRYSGLRTVMTGNLFGIWKRKFSILNALRTDFSFWQEIIIACAILFNVGRLAWEEDEEDDDSDQDTDSDTESEFDDNAGDEDEVFVIDEDRAAVRHKGQQELTNCWEPWPTSQLWIFILFENTDLINLCIMFLFWLRCISKPKPSCDSLHDELYGGYYEVDHVEGDRSWVLALNLFLWSQLAIDSFSCIVITTERVFTQRTSNLVAPSFAF